MNLQFVAQPYLPHGSSEPIVARTMLQTRELIQAFPISEEIRQRIVDVSHDVMVRLLACNDACLRISAQVSDAQETLTREGIDLQAGGRFANLPGVTNLQSDTEAFLQSAKLALREIARVFGPFYDTNFDHRFQQIRAWAVREFGTDDPLTKLLNEDADWIARVVGMRNAVEHPASGDGTLYVKNFRASEAESGLVIQPPSWYRDNEAARPIAEEMQVILHNLLTLYEDLLCACLEKLVPKPPVAIVEIPEDQRDRKMPYRLKLELTNLKGISE